MTSAETKAAPAHSYEALGSLTDYRSSYDAVPDPNVYPGERPDQSYVIGDGMVYGIEVANREGSLDFTLTTPDGESVPIDTFLAEHGVPSMEERIPLLGFGANVSPNALANKFSKLGKSNMLGEPEDMVVPTVYGTLAGHDIVWSGAPGIKGNFIAILYGGPEVQDTKVQVAVNFLTREQLLVMNASERSYNLSTHTVEIAGKKVRAYYYAGVDTVYFENSHPVAIESIPAEGRNLTTSNTEKLMDSVVADPEIMQAATEEEPGLATVHSTADYIAYAAQLVPSEDDPRPKTRLKQIMLRAIAAAGKSSVIEDINVGHGLESWTNPSTLATYGDQMKGIYHHDVYVLPTQEVSSKEVAKKISETFTPHLVYVSGGKLEEKRKQQEK